MIGLITAFAPFILSILGFILDRASASAATKKAFLSMVEGMGREGIVSVKLHQSYQEQRKRLEAEQSP